MARPYKSIDQKQFENLCELQCTLDEICGFFECCTDTIESWCKRTYGKGFSEVFREKRGRGKISLRRSQFQLANSGNATMLIWLGRQYLGQSETKAVAIDGDVKIVDGLSQSLKELAEEMENN